jgi:competence protein ComEC
MASAGEAGIAKERLAPPRRAHARPARAPVPTAEARPRHDFRSSVARALEERRVFVLLPVFIILGLMASLMTSSAPEPVALATVGAVTAVALPLAALRSLLAVRLLVLFAAFWTGFSLLAIHGALSGTTMLRVPAYGAYTARVDEVLSTDAEGQRLIVSAIAPEGAARALPIRRARLTLGDGSHFGVGDVIEGPIRFYAVPGPVLPNGYDGQFSGYFDGIGAYATATGPLGMVTPGNPGGLARIVDGIRGAIAARIDAALVQPSAGIARAIVTGDQSAVTHEARDVMATAGIAHVLSVSGLHLTLVAGGVFAALRLLLSQSEALTRRVPTKRLAAVGGIAAALAYFAISGGNVAAIRATVMIILVFGAVIFGRRALTMRNVAIAALLVELIDPASVFMPSFQLSFAAVVALIGVWELGRRERTRDSSPMARVFGYLGGTAATSLVAGAATLLFSAYHFQQTSPLGVLGNLLTLPLVGFVMMPAAFVSVVAMPVGLEWPFLSAMGWSIDRMLDLAGLVAGWSGGIDASPLLTPVALLIGVLALGWFAFLADRWRLLGPALALPAVMLFGLDQPPDALVADTTQAVAIRTADGLQLVAGRPGSFAVGVWEETYGGPIAAATEGIVRCDSIGCIAHSSAGFTVAIEKDPSAFYEDCGNADLVIARIAVPQACHAGTVIDARALAVRGVHWLHWNAGARRFEVRPAIADPGRPWRTAQPAR